MLTLWLRFSWLNTAKRMRSIEVRSEQTPIGRVRRLTSRKRRSMALVVLTGLRSAMDLIAPASKQIIEVVTQASDRFWIILLPAGSEAPGGQTGLRHGLGVHDGLKIGFDRGLVSDAHLGKEVADLMRPAALHRYTGISGRQCCQQTRAASTQIISSSWLSRPRADQVAEKALPFGGTFALRQAEVDDLLLPSSRSPRATRTGRLMAPAPVLRANTTPSSISTR